VIFKKILVIRLSSLGDVILTTPLLKVLKQNYPQSKIDYLVKHEYSDVLKNNPNTDNLITCDDDINFSGLTKLKKQIKSNKYDLIIDAHNNLRTFYLQLFLNSKKIKFKKFSIRKFLLVRFKINLMKDFPSVSQRYCEILKPLGISAPAVLHEIFPDESSKQKVDLLFKELNLSKDKKIICIIPSSKHFTKTYPEEKYCELINKFDAARYSFILIGKETDKINIDKIKSKTGSNVYDLCDKLNVLETAELMKNCWLVISGDTGPMHIAEAVNAPLIMLAGSSVKEFGFYPKNKNSIVLENNTLKCRPCSHIGKSSCPEGHFKCMSEIKPDQIFEKIE
jgi:heptosyltransferase-2